MLSYTSDIVFFLLLAWLTVPWDFFLFNTLHWQITGMATDVFRTEKNHPTKKTLRCKSRCPIVGRKKSDVKSKLKKNKAVSEEAKMQDFSSLVRIKKINKRRGIQSINSAKKNYKKKTDETKFNKLLTNVTITLERSNVFTWNWNSAHFWPNVYSSLW